MQTNATVEAYDKYADIYDKEVIAFWQHFPRTFIDAFVTSLPGNKVLNLGSGSGRDALLLRERGLQVVCVDASKKMVAITKSMSFESHCMLFSELNFHDQSFDGVWAYTSLIHIPKPEARDTVRNIHAILKPNGAFVVGAIQGTTAGIVERTTMPSVVRYFKKYTSKELNRLVEPTGFRLLYEQDYQPHNSIYLNQLYKKT